MNFRLMATYILIYLSIVFALDKDFDDVNANGVWDPGESFTDANWNFQHDGAEEFTDDNGNGVWDQGEALTDLNWNGVWDDAEQFSDIGNGIWDEGESFTDTNGNGEWDSSESRILEEELQHSLIEKTIWMRVINNFGNEFYIRDTNWPKFQNVTVDEYKRIGRDFTIKKGTLASEISISSLGNQGIAIIENDGIGGEGLSLNFSGISSGGDSSVINALTFARDTAIAERDARPTQEAYNAVVAERDARPTQEAYDALNQEVQTKLSLDEIRDLRPGSAMLEIIDGKAQIQMQMEESDDLNIWTTGGTASIEVPIEAGANKKFYRVKIQDN